MHNSIFGYLRQGWPKLEDIKVRYDYLQKFGGRSHVDWMTQMLRYMLSTQIFLRLIRSRKDQYYFRSPHQHYKSLMQFAVRERRFGRFWYRAML
jgi:hypothetical protein